MSLLNTTYKALMAEHNSMVKDAYKCTDLAAFESYIQSEVSTDFGTENTDAYIEISSNETLSGNPYMLEFDWQEA